MTVDRFVGQIAGAGSASGVRFVVGSWDRSPWGPFADAMVEQADGHRTLLAPTEAVADYVGATYTFDTVRLTPVLVERTAHRWDIHAGPLQAAVAIGGPTRVGRLLEVLPRRATTARWFAALVSPIARVAMPGVRTRGSAGGGRTEWYAAHAVHHVTSLIGEFDGQDLGDLAPVAPPTRFGFSSSPPSPSVTSLVTYVERR
jgi:hypothetical protein